MHADGLIHIGIIKAQGENGAADYYTMFCIHYNCNKWLLMPHIVVINLDNELHVLIMG